MISRMMLKFSLFLFVACVSCSEQQYDTVLSDKFFAPTNGVDKVHVEQAAHKAGMGKIPVAQVESASKLMFKKMLSDDKE